MRAAAGWPRERRCTDRDEDRGGRRWPRAALAGRGAGPGVAAAPRAGRRSTCWRSSTVRPGARRAAVAPAGPPEASRLAAEPAAGPTAASRPRGGRARGCPARRARGRRVARAGAARCSGCRANPTGPPATSHQTGDSCRRSGCGCAGRRRSATSLDGRSRSWARARRPPTASTSPPSSAPGWPSAVGRWCRAAPTASTRRPPGRAGASAAARSPCWPAASTALPARGTTRCSPGSPRAAC